MPEPARRAEVVDQIQRCVQFALRGVVPQRMHEERRREKRHPFPYPVKLQPVDGRGVTCGTPIVVLGKHLTNHGLDFYYQQPISHRRVIASFSSDPCGDVELLMDLNWCRFSGHVWYENGGRFLSVVTAPRFAWDVTAACETLLPALANATV